MRGYIHARVSASRMASKNFLVGAGLTYIHSHVNTRMSISFAHGEQELGGGSASSGGPSPGYSKSYMEYLARNEYLKFEMKSTCKM